MNPEPILLPDSHAVDLPPRPSPRYERLAAGLFRLLAPSLPRVELPDPPKALWPWEYLSVERGDGLGPLSATWYPAEGRPRGAVLLLHPWLEWARAYFHRRGRIQALRAGGYHALTVDLGGLGNSHRRPGFPDRDVEAALATVRQRAGGLPVHVWGVSAGAYWSHFALARQRDVLGGMFEDVSPHLLEWSWRMAPYGRPFYLFYRQVLRGAYEYLDVRRHAAALPLRAVTYVSGELDRGVRPEDTRTLAAAAGGRCLIVPGARHLESIKLATREILDLALDTFRRAEQAPTRLRNA
jgi:pimeloyl-ACP methyl ester carboxylesterase